MLLETFLAVNCAIVSSKMIYTKTEKNEEIEKNILEQGLYHITTPEAAEKIMETGYIKPSGNISSLGSKKCFFFAGTPDYQSLIQNVANIKGYEMTAIKLNPTAEQLSSYKVRSYHDNAVIYKGECILEDKQAQKVTLVMDIDEKGKIFTREKTQEEIEKGTFEPKEEVKKQLPLEDNLWKQAESLGKSYLHELEILWSNIKKIGKHLAFWKKEKQLLLEPPKEIVNKGRENLENRISQNGKLKNADKEVLSNWKEPEKNVQEINRELE